MIDAYNFRAVYRPLRVRPIPSPIAFVTLTAGYRRTGGAPLHNDLERFIRLFIN